MNRNKTSEISLQFSFWNSSTTNFRHFLTGVPNENQLRCKNDVASSVEGLVSLCIIQQYLRLFSILTWHQLWLTTVEQSCILACWSAGHSPRQPLCVGCRCGRFSLIYELLLQLLTLACGSYGGGGGVFFDGWLCRTAPVRKKVSPISLFAGLFALQLLLFLLLLHQTHYRTCKSRAIIRPSRSR